MLYTVTLSPSLDYTVWTDKLTAGAVNRAYDTRIVAGGKGVNVSVVLKNLGCENTALGFAAGFTGAEIERLLKENGVDTCFLHLPQGNSRINVKLSGEQETEINADSPYIPPRSLEALWQELDKLHSGDCLVLAGSIPSCLPDTLYLDIMTRLKGRGIRIIADASGSSLVSLLKGEPFLVKPNHIELGEIFGISITTPEEAVKYAVAMQESGAENVLVSMAQMGAVLACKSGERLYCSAPKGKAVNSVGAGDSMVAGFLAALTQGESMANALKTGAAAGSASVFSGALATKEAVMALMPEIVVKSI